MTEDQMMLAATLYADQKKNDPITDDEIKQYIHEIEPKKLCFAINNL